MGENRILAEETYRSLIERANDGIVIIQDMQFKYVNPRLAEILGCGVEELLDKPFADYVHPQDRAKVVDRYQRRMRGEGLPGTSPIPTIYQVKLRRKDGSDVLVELNAGLTTYQGEPADLAIVRDITDRGLAPHARRLEQEVRKRQLYLEGVLESTPDAIVTLDPDHRVSEWNPGAEKLFGYSSEEAVGRDLDALIAGPDPEMFEQATKLTWHVLAGEVVPRAESTRYRKDGTPVNVILAGAPIEVEDESVGAVVAYTDITQRKQVEEALRRRTQQLEALRDVGLDIIGELELDELLQSIVKQGCRLLGVKGGSLYLVDGCRQGKRPSSRYLVGTKRARRRHAPEAEGGLEQVVSYGYKRDRTGSRITRGEGTAGKAWQEGKPVVVDDYHHWEGRAAEWEDEELTASLAVPLKHGDQIVGTLGFDAVTEDRSFDEDDVWLTSLFANQATIAIENARLYEETAYRLAETEALRKVMLAAASTLDLDQLLERSLRVIHRALDIKHLSFSFPDDSGEFMVVHPSQIGFSVPPGEALRLPMDASVAGRAYVNQSPVLIKDTSETPYYHEYKPEMRSELTVPVFIGDEVVGVLNAESPEVGAFDEGTLHIFEAVAAQLATAMENVRLHEETERRASRLRAVNRVARRANSLLHLDDLVEAAYQEIDSTFEVDAFFLALYDREEDELDFRLSVDEGTREPPLRRPLEPGLTASVVSKGEPLLIYDYVCEQEREDLPPAETWGTGKISRSWLGVPMRAAGEVTGVISVQAYRSFAYDDEDEQLLSTIADQVAMALEKTRLYEESQRRASQAALLYEVGRHVSSELEPDILLDTIVSSVRESFDYHNVILMLLDGWVGAAGEGLKPSPREGGYTSSRGYTSSHDEHAAEERLRMQSIAGAYVGILPPDISLAIGEGMIGYAALSGETQLSNDVSTDPHYVRKATENTKSELAVPIKSGDRVIGVLDLQDDELGAFDQSDVTTLETLSSQIAAAIENARLFQAERERSAQLATVSKVAESITSTLDPRVEAPDDGSKGDVAFSPVLDRTVEMITEAFDYYYASIMLLDEESGDLLFKAGAGGFAGGTAEQMPPDFHQAIGEGMIGWVAEQGETLLANDVSQEPRYIPAYLDETKSELDVPLNYRDKVIGVLDLQSKELDAFNEHDVMAMEALAGHVAAAIENARLFGVARRRVAELRAVRQASLQLTSTLELEPVLETILENALNLVAADDAHIFLYDSGDRSHSLGRRITDLPGAGRREAGKGGAGGEEAGRVGARRGDEQGGKLTFGAAMWDGERREEPIDTIRPHGLTYTVARRGERIVVSDAMNHPIFEGRRWDGAIVGLPLTIGDEVQGVMNVAYQHPHVFTDEELWVLDLLSDQAAIAIRNARLYDEARDRALEQETLREAALALTTALERDEVVERVLAQTQRVVPYDTASVMLLSGDCVDIVGGRGFPNLSEIVGVSFPLSDEHPNREVIRTGEPVILEDAPEAYEAFRREPHALAEIRSWLGVPMLVGDRVIGMIALDKCTPGFYTDEHARLARAFAAQAAVAFENARLYEAEQEQRELSERLRETALLLNRSLDLQEVLEMILEQLASVVNYHSGSVQILQDDRGPRGRATEVIAARNLPGKELGHAYPLEHYAYNRRLVEEAELVVIDDVRENSQGWRGVGGLEHVRANVGVPLQVRDQVIGILTVDSCHPEAYAEDDARLIQAFAQQAAVAIENARLYEEARKRALEQQTLREAALAMTTALERDEVVERILAQLQEVVPYDTASVQLLQDGHGDGRHYLEIVGGRGFPNLGELVGIAFDLTNGDHPNRTVICTRQPLILRDAGASYEEFRREPHRQAGMRSWLGVPMLVGDRLIGMITLDKREPEFYNHEHARLAEAFAAQAGIAIENAQLHQETVRQLAETEVLRETMLAAASTLDFDEVLARTIDVLERAMGIEYLGFMLPEEDRSSGETSMVSHPCVLGFTPPEEGYRFPVDECLTGQVYQTGEPRILSDVREEGPYAVAAEEVRSELAVPVKAGDEVVAVLNLESAHPGAFDEQDLAFYTAIAGQLGIAMENAQLFEAERKQRQLSEALEKAAVAVSSTLELEQVLDRILKQVEQVVPGDSFNIMLIEDSEAHIVRSRGYERLGVMEAVRTYSLPVSDYPHWVEMSRSGEPVVISDTALDDGCSFSYWSGREGGDRRQDEDGRHPWDWLRSYVAAPIRVGDTTVGFLNVDGLEPGQFSFSDAVRLETFASHAATAIENARLYERLRDHAETLELRVAERTAQLQAQYGRLEAILDSTVDGIVVTGPDGELVLANPVAREWLTQTLSPEEAGLLRLTIREMAQRAGGGPPGEDLEEVLELTGLDLQLRAATIHKPGSEEDGHHPDAKAGDPAAVVAIHDISHLKALDRMKSRFVSNVSHELRTPIATIKLFVHLMRKQPGKWQEYLEPLAQEAEHQADLVGDILEISRVDVGRLEIKREPANLEGLVDIVVTNCETRAQERGLTLEHGDVGRPCAPGEDVRARLDAGDAQGTETLSALPVAMVDTQRMTQVLDNLINNAIRYTPEGGKITVWTGRAEVGGRAWGTVTVADTGMGIPEDELPHVFERFFRGEKPRTMQISGTGLGLAIVKEIIELHGGHVTVESEVGEGSRFTVWLPAVDALAGVDDAAELPGPRSELDGERDKGAVG